MPISSLPSTLAENPSNGFLSIASVAVDRLARRQIVVGILEHHGQPLGAADHQERADPARAGIRSRPRSAAGSCRPATLPSVPRSSDASQPAIFCLSSMPAGPAAVGRPERFLGRARARHRQIARLRVGRTIDGDVELLAALFEPAERVAGQIERDGAGIDAVAIGTQSTAWLSFPAPKARRPHRPDGGPAFAGDRKRRRPETHGRRERSPPDRPEWLQAGFCRR